MASAEPEYSLEELYAEASRRGWLKDDPELQALGHEVRRRGWIKDPTQGGLFPEKPAAAAPALPKSPTALTTGGVPVLPDARGLTFDKLPQVSEVAPGVTAPKPGRVKTPKVTKPQPFTVPAIQPFTFDRLPEEDAYDQAAQALAKVPSYLRTTTPKTVGELRALEGGRQRAVPAHSPVRMVEGQERAALAGLARQLPKIDEGLAGKATALQAQRKQLDQAIAAYNKGARTPEQAAQIKAAQDAYERNRQAFNRRMGERDRYAQAFRSLPRGEPLHGGALYPQETITEGTGLGAAFAVTPVGRVLSGAVNFLNPAQVTTQRVREGLPAARNVLQLTGAYPALPPLPKGTPDQQAELIRQKNALIEAAYVLGPMLRPDGTLDRSRATQLPSSQEVASRRPEAFRTLSNLTPWQRQLLPVVIQQLAAERKAQEMAGIGEGVLMDAAAFIVGAGVGKAVGGAVAKRAYEKVLPFLSDPVFGAATGAAGLTGRVGFASPVSKAVLRELARPIPALAGSAAGGGAAGGVVGTGLGLIESKGDVGKALEAGAAGARTGAVAGLAFGGVAALTARAVSQLKTYRTGETDARVSSIADDIGRRLNLAPEEVGALQNRLLEIAKAPSYRKNTLRDALTRDLNARRVASPGAAEVPPPKSAPRAKATTARPAARPAAPKAPPAEPVVRVADGPEVPVRRASLDDLRAAEQQAQAAGDAVAAANIAAVAERHEQWQAANQVVGDGATAQNLLSEWNRGDHPQRRRYNVLDTAANRTDDPALGPILRQAADDARLAFGRERFGPGVPTPNPNVSAWRHLSDDQQLAVPPPVREALLRQDIENSASVLGVDPEALAPKKATPAALIQAADEAFARAQERVAVEWLPSIGTEIGAPSPGSAGIPTEIPTTGRDTDVIPSTQGEVLPPPVPMGNVGPGQRWRHEPSGVVIETLPGGQARIVAAGTSGARVGEVFDIAAGDLSREFVPLDRMDAPGALPGSTLAVHAPLMLPQGAPPQGLPQPFEPSPKAPPALELPAVEAIPMPGVVGEAAANSRQPDANAESLQQPKPDTKPDTVTRYAGPERRVDAERRKKVAEMTEDELRREFLTDEKTGLGNKRAWDEAEKKAHIGYIDADGLSFVNGAYGHPAGDALLKALGDNLLRAGFTKEDAFHISGDEFVVQGNDRADLKRRILAARELHEATVISFVDESGQTRSFKGVSFSQGIGPTEARADKAMLSEKAKRDDAGQRAKSKDVYLKDKQGRTTTKLNPAARPPGLVEVGDGGGPVQKGAGAPGPAPKRRGSGGDSQKARAVAPKKAAPKPDAAVPASTRARMNADAAAAKARGKKGGEAVAVRAEGDAGPRTVMSDVPGAVQGAKHKGRKPGDCG